MTTEDTLIDQNRIEYISCVLSVEEKFGMEFTSTKEGIRGMYI